MITNLNYGNLYYNRGWYDTLLFIDFDGTPIRSYSNNQIQSLTSLPPVPNHTNDDIPLTSQGWNWSLYSIKLYNSKYPNTMITVGPQYCTTDGKTHVIGKGGTVTFVIGGSTPIIVDLCDGSEPTIFPPGLISFNYPHQTIHYTLTPAIDDGDNDYGFEPRSDTYHIRCGQHIRDIGSFASLHPFDSLEDISVVKGMTILDLNGGNNNNKLKAVVVPQHEGIVYTGIHISGFNSLMGIASSAAGRSSTSSKFNSFNIGNCPKLFRFTMPDGCNRFRLGEKIYANTIVVGGGIKYLEADNVYESLIIGEQVEEILDYRAFPQGHYNIYMKGTTPPTCNANLFKYNYPGWIFVPYSNNHSVLNAYKRAAGWSNAADIIKEESQ